MSENTKPRKAEFLVRVKEKLDASGDLKTAMGGTRWWNNVPQDTKLPILRFRFSQANEFDTKDSDGWQGTLSIDVWTDSRGDLESTKIQDIVDDIFQDGEFALQDGQNLFIQHTFFDAFTEPDGITHHAVTQYNVIITN